MQQPRQQRLDVRIRRNKVLALLMEGKRRKQIAHVLDVDPSTIDEDVKALRPLVEARCAATLDTLLTRLATAA